jgi:hypothetical protein
VEGGVERERPDFQYSPLPPSKKRRAGEVDDFCNEEDDKRDYRHRSR